MPCGSNGLPEITRPPARWSAVMCTCGSANPSSDPWNGLPWAFSPASFALAPGATASAASATATEIHPLI